MATLKSALVAALSILLLGLIPVLAASPASAACVTMSGDPCQTARQYRRAFNHGDLGNSRVAKSKWPRAFKVKLRKVVTRKGLIPPANAALSARQRATYKYADWGHYWTALNNAVDCVAPGAESSCRKDFGTIKALKEPAKVVVGCGGLAIASYYSGGFTAAAATEGGLTCGWGIAIANW